LSPMLPTIIAARDFAAQSCMFRWRYACLCEEVPVRRHQYILRRGVVA